jgi:glutathione S-transferase
VRVIGSYLSPYVRKVLVCLHLKGIDYEIDPIIPFFGDDRFTRLSPLRRVPVLVDDRVTLADSSVICQYLEESHPEPALYPAEVADRARARWLEEWADTRLGEVFVWRLFHERAIRPFVWGEKTDEEVVRRTLAEDVPDALGYLEAQLPARGFLFGAPGIADVSVACFFRNAAFARFAVDAGRWPVTAGFVERVLALEAFARLRPLEERMLRTRIPEQRAALAALGAPLTPETLATGAPRRGVLAI